MDLDTKIEILYPEHRLVPARQIYRWACDEVDNGKTVSKKHPMTFAEAIGILEDSGAVTFHKSIDAILNDPFVYEFIEA